jgi:hypothetical protein
VGDQDVIDARPSQRGGARKAHEPVGTPIDGGRRGAEAPLAELAHRAGVPPGVFNVVPADSRLVVVR